MAGARACLDCPIGTFSAGPGVSLLFPTLCSFALQLSGCTPCSEGTSQPDTAKDTCEDCPAGFFQVAQCFRSAYPHAPQPATSQDSCLPCAIGMHALLRSRPTHEPVQQAPSQTARRHKAASIVHLANSRTRHSRLCVWYETVTVPSGHLTVLLQDCPFGRFNDVFKQGACTKCPAGVIAATQVPLPNPWLLQQHSSTHRAKLHASTA